jgi:hypothetical protein
MIGSKLPLQMQQGDSFAGHLGCDLHLAIDDVEPDGRGEELELPGCL